MIKKLLNIITYIFIIIIIGIVIAIAKNTAIFFLPVVIVIILNLIRDIMILLKKHEYLSKLNRIIDIATYIIYIYIIIWFVIFLLYKYF